MDYPIVWPKAVITYSLYATRFTLRQTRFRSFHATSLECHLWRRANRIERIPYTIYSYVITALWFGCLLCDWEVMGSNPGQVIPKALKLVPSCQALAIRKMGSRGVNMRRYKWTNPRCSFDHRHFDCFQQTCGLGLWKQR